MRDPRTIEMVKAPYLLVNEILQGGRPNVDCDDITGLLAALLLAVGCQVRVITVAFKHMFYKGERQYSHVFVQAREPRSGSWVILDPVAGRQVSKMRNQVVAMHIWPVA
jgi:hypothetical protein